MPPSSSLAPMRLSFAERTSGFLEKLLRLEHRPGEAEASLGVLPCLARSEVRRPPAAAGFLAAQQRRADACCLSLPAQCATRPSKKDLPGRAGDRARYHRTHRVTPCRQRRRATSRRRPDGRRHGTRFPAMCSTASLKPRPCLDLKQEAPSSERPALCRMIRNAASRGVEIIQRIRENVMGNKVRPRW